MIVRLVLKAVGTIATAALMAGCGGSMDSKSGNAQEPAAIDVPEVAQKAWEQALAAGFDASNPLLRGAERLSGPQITSEIVGRTLAESRSQSEGMPYPQSERFLPGGLLIVQLDRVSVRGLWVVRSDALCTEVVRPAFTQCRALYRGSSGQLFQAFFGPNKTVMPVKFI